MALDHISFCLSILLLLLCGDIDQKYVWDEYAEMRDFGSNKSKTSQNAELKIEDSLQGHKSETTWHIDLRNVCSGLCPSHTPTNYLNYL